MKKLLLKQLYEKIKAISQVNSVIFIRAHSRLPYGPEYDVLFVLKSTLRGLGPVYLQYKQKQAPLQPDCLKENYINNKYSFEIKETEKILPVSIDRQCLEVSSVKECEVTLFVTTELFIGITL